MDKETGQPRLDQRVFHRVFDSNETAEIRLYLHGGDDKVFVKGEVESSILVRVVGGKGDDELTDESHVHGCLWGLIPFISSAERLTFFYDHAGRNQVTIGPSSCFDAEDYQSPPGGTYQY
jgi:hypothetical protein